MIGWTVKVSSQGSSVLIRAKKIIPSGEEVRHKEVPMNILELMNDITVNFVKIPSQFNYEADRLAKQAASDF